MSVTYMHAHPHLISAISFQAVPQPVHHLLEVMLQQSTAIVSCPPSKYQMELVQQPAHNSVEDKLAAALDELWKTGTFLPDHPILRKATAIWLTNTTTATQVCVLCCVSCHYV